MKKYSLGLLALVMIFVGCERLPSWTPEYLGPVAKTRITVEDISEVRDIIITQEVLGDDVDPQWSGNVPQVPAGDYGNSATFLFELSEEVALLDADTLEFVINFTNGYPINIKQGTILAFYNNDLQNTSQDGNPVDTSLLFTHEVRNDIAPGEEYSFTELLEDIRVNSDLRFRLEEFQTDGSSSSVTFDNQTFTDFTFNLVFLKINELDLVTPQSYSIVDTADFSFQEDSEENQVRGDLTIYFDNKFPLDFGVQLLLLDDNDMLIDSFFNAPIVLASPPYDQVADEVLDSVTTINTIDLEQTRISNLQQASKIVASFTVSTVKFDKDGNPIMSNVRMTMEEDNYVDFQITADVSTKIDLNEE